MANCQCTDSTTCVFCMCAGSKRLAPGRNNNNNNIRKQVPVISIAALDGESGK